MDAKIALPLISLINFVGGSLCSIFVELNVLVVVIGVVAGVMHAGTDGRLVMIGDNDFPDFISLW